ncbi:hypothetical protein CBL_21331, partial [Carabus blaptoides fortunei]
VASSNDVATTRNDSAGTSAERLSRTPAATSEESASKTSALPGPGPAKATPAPAEATETRPAAANTTTPATWLVMGEKGLPMFPAKPKFTDGATMNPVKFLEKLEKYCAKLKIPGDQQLDTATECLAGSALDWADVYKSGWKNFNDFKTDFLRSYWSENEQNKLRYRISTAKWDSRRNDSMMNHLTHYVSQAKLLTSAIPESILVSELIRHFPSNIQSLWMAGNKGSTVTALAEFIQKQESITTSKSVSGTSRTDHRVESIQTFPLRPVPPFTWRPRDPFAPRQHSPQHRGNDSRGRGVPRGTNHHRCNARGYVSGNDRRVQ